MAARTTILQHKTNMIVDPSITTYIHSLDSDSSPFFDEMRTYAEENGVPIIRREMESFIRVILDLKKPKKVLEIGAGIAYSTCFIASCLADADITTIENYAPRIELARNNIAASGMAARIHLIEDDAANVLPALEPGYDFIFLDAAKGQYMAFLPELLRLLPPGGVLLADNVLQDGELVMSRYVTPRRQRTIHDRMREFVWEVKHSSELETSLITIGDGVTLSIRK